MQFIDLQAQYQVYREEINTAIQGVLDSSRYVNGPQVAALEEALARFVGVRHAVGFSSGTDSLRATLLAWGIGPGDEVITTPFTFVATAEVIAILGARPVFVDVEPETLNLDPTGLEQAITPRTRAIIPVSLYGQCANMPAIHAIAQKHGLHCLEDACQSLGASCHGQRSGSLTEAAAVSFFPAKPLGCYGDGGMVFTDDADLAGKLRMVREHGQVARYRHAMPGMNGRLDSIQAAILLAKLPHFEKEIDLRQQVARYYTERLAGRVRLPVIRPGHVSVFSQFTILVDNREQVIRACEAAGVPTAVHYPIPLHHQPVFATGPLALGYAENDFPVAVRAAREVLSLPMHPFLTSDQQDLVVQTVLQAVAGR
ncbi:MAG: DegT/DnrJ/EryC1/StrS family aminotransferase [Magnetococcus sp. DMHC-1]|nr:DegT/DnrJ/EryC1/StrS family aminotransferase [Magnetococcales bacterium]